MAQVTFKKEEMLRMLDGDGGVGKVLEDEIVDTSRWSEIHELIFSREGRTYQTGYSRAATECQEEQPWEYDQGEISCTEVHQVERLVKVWEPIE